MAFQCVALIHNLMPVRQESREGMTGTLGIEWTMREWILDNKMDKRSIKLFLSYDQYRNFHLVPYRIDGLSP